ncbi:MAG: hypothetical protein OEX07_01005 [Gammaproteobacteria bacterium]|nr:hypothetical protein [Gammaproteobacteria bacterium]
MIKVLSVCIAIFTFTFSQSVLANERTFELSFGTSQMLVDDVDRADIKDRKKVILPTTGALLIAEYLWNDRWGTIFAFNLPLVTQKFVVNNELIEETAAKTYLLGQRFSPFTWHLTKTASLSPQISALLSAMVGSSTQFSPSLAGRIHITDQGGFSMYLGSTVTYGIKGYVLFYGIGHQF